MARFIRYIDLKLFRDHTINFILDKTHFAVLPCTTKKHCNISEIDTQIYHHRNSQTYFDVANQVPICLLSIYYWVRSENPPNREAHEWHETKTDEPLLIANHQKTIPRCLT